jgi:RHS repeat-associated protein
VAGWAAGSGLASQYEYLFTDHLGSTHRITDANGLVQSANGAQAFTPFGGRAVPATGASLDSLGAQAWFQFDSRLTHHGFTGHEMMDETDLIHMNGRVYDPRLLRFIQADPFVANAGNLQSYNRYSYVLNNPMMTTDPTGYWGHRQQGYLREAAAIAIAAYTGYYFAPGGAGAALAGTNDAIATQVAAGFASGYISSGNLNGAVIGAFSAGLNIGISAYVPPEFDS